MGYPYNIYQSKSNAAPIVLGLGSTCKTNPTILFPFSNSSRDQIHVVPYEALVAGQLPYSGCNLVEIHRRRNAQKKATDERKAKESKAIFHSLITD